MLLSMTGYGEGHGQLDGLQATAELRSVNNRHLKIVCRFSEGYAALEAQAETYLRTRLKRGTVTLSMRIVRQSGADDYRINRAVLQGYLDQLQGFGQPVPVQSLLTLPGVVESSDPGSADVERVWEVAREALDQAIERLNEMRSAEGAAMAAELEQLAATIGEHVDWVEQRAPQIVAAYTSRLVERLNQMLAEHQVQAGPQDVIREVGMFADRVDVAEEIVRLRSHLDQMQSTIQSEESAGRKLEFLVQELFREGNTIASKANDAQVAQRVVEIKAAIERMRELVQNVE